MLARIVTNEEHSNEFWLAQSHFLAKWNSRSIGFHRMAWEIQKSPWNWKSKHPRGKNILWQKKLLSLFYRSYIKWRKNRVQLLSKSKTLMKQESCENVCLTEPWCHAVKNLHLASRNQKITWPSLVVQMPQAHINWNQLWLEHLQSHNVLKI